MKYFLLILLCEIVFHSTQSELFLPRHGLPSAGPPKLRAIEPSWSAVEQKLDHFDPQNNKTWNMRFLHNGQFYKQGGPMFIMLGAEWTIDKTWLQNGQMFDMAQEHNAIMFYTEHRYYGASFPTSDLSPDNLKYLTVDLGLADVASFIQQMRSKIPALAQSKVVAFGGSYGADMAIWMRQKYPNLIHAAVSSSGPVLAQVNFKEYDEVVQEVLGDECSSVISNGIEMVQELLTTSKGVLKVQKDFNLCNPINIHNQLDLSYFFSIISTKFGGIVQYATGDIVQRTCNALRFPTNVDDYTRLARYISRINENKCLSNYDKLLQHMGNWAIGTGNVRQWQYQTCTEFGFYQTTDSPNQPYGQTLPIDIYYSWCQDFFGAKFTSAVIHNGVDTINRKYGGLNPNVTRVVSVHGTGDPWYRLGLSQNNDSVAPVILVKDTSHCADLNSISASDSVELKNAKKAVKAYIRTWLAED